MIRLIRLQQPGSRRRGATIVMIAVTLPVLMAFLAMSIDVGIMYNAKTDLQRAADAAALAAASRLGMHGEGDVTVLGRAAAREILIPNTVLGKTITLQDSDITFGQADIDPQTGAVTFTPTNVFPDAVRVVARKTADSPNGRLPLIFGGFTGLIDTDVTAEAIAMLLPRDIAIVADLSGSHSYDSRLRYYRQAEINLFDVWAGLPGGINDDDSVWDDVNAEDLSAAEAAQRSGPAWGLFKRLGFGRTDIPSNYEPNQDSGLVRLPEDRNWSDATVLSALRDQGYSDDEIGAIMSGARDRYGNYVNRVAVALGLAVWSSGMPGGLWESLGLDPADAGDRDGRMESREVVFVERFGDRSVSDSAAIWRDYIDNYVSSQRSSMYDANRNFRYQYGLKTFVDYLLNNRESNRDTPELSETPHQPMQAVKDAVNRMVEIVEQLNSNDRMSLEVYSTRGRHEIDLTIDYQQIAQRLMQMQAAHYDPYTNMGAGILRGIEELSGQRSNSHSHKVMIVLTDGNANVGCDTCTRFDPSGGRSFARSMARRAKDEGIQLYTVSVGAGADVDLMDEIAEIGGGTHFHAQGTIDEYSAQLEAIFEELGGMRPVQLIK